MRVTSATALQSEINITPLVDVCLVLLIIFMVVTPLMVGVPVDLPRAGTASEMAKRPLQVTVKSDGTIYVDSAVLRADELLGELQRRRAEHERPVVVRADKILSYGEVVRVLDACRDAGFNSVGLAAEKPVTGNR